MVSSTSTTWRHGSNEVEASLHADARRLRETVEEKAARAGRTNPSRSGFEATRHGPCGMLNSKRINPILFFFLAFTNRLFDAKRVGKFNLKFCVC